MELRHLRYFLAIAEHGTVTAAAARLHVAQPAISRQLQRLEHDLGIRLFARHGPRLALTDAGRHMLGVASDIVARADRATIVAQQMAQGHLTRVSVAAATTTIEYVLAPFVATLDAHDPFVSVVEVPSEAVHDAVFGGHDLGLAATSPPVSRLSWTRLTSVPLRAYVSSEHAWALRPTVSLGELSQAPLLLPTPADPTRIVFDEAINRAKLQYHNYEEVESPPLRQALAAADRGVAVVTDLQRFGARPLLILDHRGEPILLTIHACWNPAHYAAEALSAFAEQLGRYSDTVVRQTAERI
ncbi:MULTISPECIES: LysR family transcriptional regulator [unclassified Mycolicibacterium]|uniref:LysR family transcriptional regulator n=1 Tax=unclassified Mycolicibacterium TaxID=2636767 RepID=UPI0012DC8AAF|nr:MULTISPECIES: LysR family transcriptional regulator [unclassified Mycolicibacterium]MUL85011.1 LysR family transcriptional regulator [Mycolicibacterium sp. CBMA 329]MUL90978.1 LysR family transcriptional regulator [Mycolicibacterium sp. CBMA 331]MUL98351.1 LysR family transcriptional regulator [Mycolicibacterium sp. CBMA 334]MUM28596.1 LysR family transcriptional regulator [Mycolicibacterium sp. CBMA 295]MUM40737.1 LysR family transcriptional regulator [Mycolicibacterium sp. CBMA 247]